MNRSEVKRTKRMAKMLLGAAFFILHSSFFISCSDVLETDGTRDLFNRELNQKTDSIFMANGILQCMQQLADQYVLTGEMRGDLTSTTYYTNEHLRHLADFSATTANKYDSAYVYYAVINNCNYYIAHRDTSLYIGSTNVTINEYAAVKALRAWAYLMLTRHYGQVPFFTQPLTRISDINNGNYPLYTMRQVVDALAPELEALEQTYGRLPVPDYGTIACGITNKGVSKSAQSKLCFIPVDVILGEMYLETQQYPEAAHYYSKYLIENHVQTGNRVNAPSADWNPEYLQPDDYKSVDGTSWRNFFTTNNSTDDIITYIPMSVNRLRGTVSRVPEIFGYDYYAVSGESSYLNEVQIAPSKAYTQQADSTDYYYATDAFGTTVKAMRIGDMRRSATISAPSSQGDTGMREALEAFYTSPDTYIGELPRIKKYNYGNIVLYRGTTVYLHLAEALNRMGYYDLAFAILKDGVDRQLLTSAYLSDASKQLLQTTYPFLSAENISIFDAPAGSASSKVAYGIHKHGCGYTNGNFSPYQLNTILGDKLTELHPSATSFTRNDSIDAMEDLLCDEYAMEFAFEGSRFNDLCRIARHKNAVSAGAGSLWLANKLAYKNPTKDLTDEQNWYLPLK